MHGNVTVLGGMHLTLLRSTLEIVGNTNGTHWFNASARSVLTVQNGTIRGSPYHISIRLDGTVHMVDSTVENVWTTSATPAIDISGAASWLRTTVQGCPNSTGVLVTGALEAEDCEFKDMGEVALAFSDPRFPNRSFVGNSTFVSDVDITGDTIGIAVQWSSNTNRTVDLTVYGCSFDGFTFGIQAFVNTTRANLSVHSSRFYECSTGLQVTGNGARITITGCTFD
ncbi:MAG: hypothetical protein KAJ35_06020, partial [Thermoplasmata archaeon]|nr:hypothetical protein [Thermoplasmata archaeon]